MREFCRCRWERKHRRHGRCPTRTAKMMQTMLPLLMMLVGTGVMLALPGPSDAMLSALIGPVSRPQKVVVPVSAAVTPPSSEERQAARAHVRDLLLAPPDAAVAVTVARLHPQKGVDVWLDAASILVARGADLHLAWIGDGELLGEVTEAPVT